MCGIAGIMRFGGRRVEPQEIEKLTATLAHRGPDGSGTFISSGGNVALGHTRLAILDLTDKAAQPMTDVSGTMTIVYNGEIYNFLEIRSELETLGHSFRSESDTEVLLAGFREWKEDIFQKLNGMWAILLWDAENESGILWEHSTGTRAFSFEATKDEYLGNMKNITLDSASTGRIYISGNPSKSLRYKYRLTCSTAGVVETAVFTLSIDGGLTYSGSYNTYANYTHITDGFYVRFEGTFVLNDEWELWAATTKSKTNSRLGSIDLIPV